MHRYQVLIEYVGTKFIGWQIQAKGKSIQKLIQIKWNETAENIIGIINGLYPSPGAFFIYSGERYKILKAELSFSSGEVGEVLDNYLEISCGNKRSIKVLEIQRQGKRPQSISEFMLGSQIKKGSNLNNA